MTKQRDQIVIEIMGRYGMDRAAAEEFLNGCLTVMLEMVLEDEQAATAISDPQFSQV